MTLTSAGAHSGGNCSPVTCFRYSSVELALITATLDASLDHLVGGQYDDPMMFNAGDLGGVAGLLDALRDIGADEAASVMAIEGSGRFNGLLKTLRYAEVDDAFGYGAAVKIRPTTRWCRIGVLGMTESDRSE